MRKRTTALLSVLSLSLLLTACQEKIEQKQSIGVVDTASIYANSKAGLEAGDYLEKLQMTMQEELVALQESMQADPSEANIILFQEKYASFQERMTLEQEQVVTALNGALQEAMDSYRKERGLEVLIASETVMSMSAEADVTKDIIVAMDKLNVVYTPVVMPEPAPVMAPVEAPAVASEVEVAPKVEAETETTPEVVPETTPEATPVAQ